MHRGGGSVNCTRTCCRAYSGTRTTLVETRKNPREHNLLYRENDPFEHVSASTSRGIKNFFSTEIKMQTFAHKNIHIFIYKRIHTYTCVFKKRMSKNDKIRSSTHDYQISVWPWYQGRKNWPIGRNCAFPSTMNRRKSGKKKIHVCEYNIDFWRAVFSSFSNFFFCSIVGARFIYVNISLHI